jgi:hypothetical protein
LGAFFQKLAQLSNFFFVGFAPFFPTGVGEFVFYPLGNVRLRCELLARQSGQAWLALLEALGTARCSRDT